MTALIDRLRAETFEEALQILQEKKKCVIIRPTGYGKTGILTRFARPETYRHLIGGKAYRNIIYLYPKNIIKSAVLHFYYGGDIPEDEKIPGVTFLSYAKLVRMNREEMEALGNVDLIITDECHVLGADGTMTAMEMLLDVHGEAHLLGATASPDRMDSIDECARYFDDILVSPYTLHDAFSDRVLKRPHYVYNCYTHGLAGLEREKQEAAEELKKTYSETERTMIMGELEQRLIETARIYNMEHVIRSTCDKYADDTGYMKFIVFFPSYEAIREKGDEVRDWFHGAYPEHIICVTEITSENEDTKKNLALLDTMEYVEGRIDLIFVCDMLNMGYHVSDITGITMYRGTKSDTVYIQQLGRIFSSAADAKAGIVFDVVDNIHQRAAYTLLGREDIYTEDARRRVGELEAQKQSFLAYEAYVSGKDDEADLPEDVLELFRKYDSGEETPPSWTKYDQSELNAQYRRFEKRREPSRREGYALTPDDLETVELYANAREATYRELIAKTVAEARSMRCRKAWARWTEEGGKTRDENGRILTRAEILAQKAPEDIPLPPFCKSKQVSVEAVLDEMGVPEDKNM